MIIRVANSNDLAELMRMAKTVHYASDSKRWVLFEDNIAEWIFWFDVGIETHGIQNLIYVAEVKPGKLAGFLSAKLGPVFFAVGNTALSSVQLIWVDEDYRGSALGTKLIGRLCEDAKALGCTDVYITASCKHRGFKKIASVYRDLGFELEERHFIRRL